MVTQPFFMEVARNGPQNRGSFKPAPSGQFSFDLYGHNNFVDCHSSAFLLPEEAVQYATKANMSILGYPGEVFSDHLFWDIDAVDLDVAIKDTLALIGRLLTMGLGYRHIKLWFSGSKGFHVAVKTQYAVDITKPFLGINGSHNVAVKSVCSAIADGISSFDDKVYDKTRIFRIPNSINSKSGLYKIPLCVESFVSGVSAENIKSMATKQHEPIEAVSVTIEDGQFTTSLSDIISSIGDKQHSPSVKSDSPLATKVKDTPIGGRNNRLISLAGLLRNRDISEDVIHEQLILTNNGFSQPLPENEVESIFKSVMRYSPSDEYKRVGDGAIITMAEAGKKWVHIRSRASGIRTGMEHMDKMLRFFDPGQVFMVAARAGTFKTTLAMQMVNTMAREFGSYGLFASLEMNAASLFFRAATITANGGSSEPISNVEIAHNLLTDNDLFRKAVDDWANLLIVDQDSLSVNQIEAAYKMAQEKTNNNVEFLLIDYFGLISGTDDYEGASKVARMMKALSKRLNTRIILIVQLSRKGGNGTEEVEMDMLRDTGALEEAADYVFGMWADKDDGNLIHTKAAKDRYNERGARFDVINKGLKLTSVDAQKGKKGW